MEEPIDAVPEKSTSPWVWVAAGCGGLTILVVVIVVAVLAFGLFQARDFLDDVDENPVRAMAELVIRGDPDLEIVDSNDREGTFTIRDVRTGEVTTLDFQDIADGKLTVTTEEGEITMEADTSEEGGGLRVTGPEGEVRIGGGSSLANVPEWVPLFPDATEASGTYQTTSADGVTGVVVQTTDEGSREVLEWFKAWLQDEGYALEGESLTTTPGGAFGAVAGELAGGGRTVRVTVAETDEGTQVTVAYEEGS